MQVSAIAPTTTILEPARKETELDARIKADAIVNPYPDANFSKALERMYIVARGTWSSQSSGAVLNRIAFPDVFNSFANIVQKLSTFNYFTADVNVRIKLNGTIAQFGRLGYAALPVCGGSITCQNLTAWSGCTVTGSISANSPQTIEFTLPYLCPWEGLETDLETPFMIGRLWQMALYVIAPLVGTDPEPSVSYTIEAGMKNIRVWGIAQESEIVKNLTSLVPMLETDTASSRTTGSLNGFKQAVSSISPLVTAFIGTKPDSSRPVCSNTIDNLIDANIFSDSNLPTVNALDRQHTLVEPLLSEKMQIDDVVNTSFRGVAQRPALRAVTTISATATAGSLIWSDFLNPSNCVPAAGLLANQYAQPDFLAWVCQFFRYFHGSIEYMFDFCCSQLNSGAIRFVYFPPNYDAPATYTDQGDALSLVVDIRGDTVTKVVCPYLNNVAYIANNFTEAVVDDRNEFGTIAAYIERPFTGDAVDVSAYMISYRAGGSDVVFAMPFAGDLANSLDGIGSLSYYPESLLTKFKTTPTASFSKFYSEAPGRVSFPEYLDSCKTMYCTPTICASGSPSNVIATPIPFWPAIASTFGFDTPMDLWRIFALIFQFFRGGQFIQAGNPAGQFTTLTTASYSWGTGSASAERARGGIQTYSQRGYHFRYMSPLPFVDKCVELDIEAPGVNSFPSFGTNLILKKQNVNVAKYPVPPNPTPILVTTTGWGPFPFLRCADDDTMHFCIQPPPMIRYAIAP